MSEARVAVFFAAGGARRVFGRGSEVGTQRRLTDYAASPAARRSDARLD